MAFDFSLPAAVSGVDGEVVFESSPGAEPWGVGGCGDELRAAQVEVTLAGAFLRKSKAVT